MSVAIQTEIADILRRSYRAVSKKRYSELSGTPDSHVPAEARSTRGDSYY